ncbi:hypothetical protein [Arthrobacter sp. NPDC056727]
MATTLSVPGRPDNGLVRPTWVPVQVPGAGKVVGYSEGPALVRRAFV